MSTWILCFLLAVVWAVVLVPDFLSRGMARRRSDTIGNFSRQLSTLERSAPVRSNRNGNVVELRGRAAAAPSTPTRAPQAAPAAQPMVRSGAQRRRQEVLTILFALAMLTFLGAVSLGGVAVIVNAAVDAVLIAYLGLMMMATRKAKMRSQVGVLYRPDFSGVAPVHTVRQHAAR